MKACFQIAERRQSSAKLRRFFVTSKHFKKFLFQLLVENIFCNYLGGRSQLSSGSPRYSKITATCRGEKYWQPTWYPCFFNSSHKGTQRLIQSIRWRRAVALLVASGKKSKPNSVLLYIRFDISISKLHLRMMILEKAIQGLGYIGTGSDLFMLHFTFVQVIILADKPVVQLA